MEQIMRKDPLTRGNSPSGVNNIVTKKKVNFESESLLVWLSGSVIRKSSNAKNNG